VSERTASEDQATVGQVAETIATLAQAVPRDFTREDAQRVIGQKGLLHQLVGFGLTRDLKSVGLDDLLTLGDLGADGIAKALELVRSELYADEEVPSSFGYPEGWGMRQVWAQVSALRIRQFFPCLELPPVTITLLREAPPGFDGYLAWPEPSALVPGSEYPYRDALERVLEVLTEYSTFENLLKGPLHPDRLRLLEKTVEGHARAHQRAGGDWCVAPFQSGLRHGGRSVRRARMVFAENEWGAGPYEVACFLLTHPGRLTSDEYLAIDCPGVEHDHDGSGQFLEYLFFASTSRGTLQLITGPADGEVAFSGSASFLG